MNYTYIAPKSHNLVIHYMCEILNNTGHNYNKHIHVAHVTQDLEIFTTHVAVIALCGLS